MSKVLKTTVFVIIILLLFSLMFLVGITPAYALSVEDLTNNAIDSPYIINSAQDMLDLSNLVNTGSNMSGKYFVLGCDIDLSLESFSPIGSSINMFQGSFEGDNHKVTLSIDTTSIYNGLFGYIGSSAVVKNVVVSGTVKANNYLGGIAGYNAGSIINCINTATIMATSNDTSFVGGICGESIGRIDSCVNSGIVSANNYCGGIAGRNQSSTQGIFSSVNLGNVSGREGSVNASRLGGITGESKGIIANSYNYAFVNATGQRIGALVGSLVAAPSGTTNCYNIREKAARALMGHSDVAIPATFLEKSYYDFLEQSIVFAENTQKYLAYEQGYGFLPYPKTLSENAAIKAAAKICLFSSGSGTQADPFIIKDIRHWGLFQTNSYLHEYSNTYIKLNNHLVVGNIAPLFSVSKPFKGVFDGNNKTLTAYVNGGSRVGVFAVISGGTVKNVTINGTVNATGDMAGAVAGSMLLGTVDNVVNNASVAAKNYVGGIIGHASQELITLTDVKNNAQISGENQVGGLVGQANTVNFVGVENYGKISAILSTTNANFGGIVGKINISGTISTALNNGEVSAYRATNVGGIVGYGVDCGFSLVANLGAVTGRNNTGGIVGHSNDSTSYGIASAMSIATVTGAVNVGGILGLSVGVEKQIENSYYVGSLKEVSEAQINKATFYALSNSTNITNCFFNSDLATGGGGIGKNYIELTDNVFGVTETDVVWQARDMEISMGYYPIMKIDALLDNATLINSKLKVNYFSGGIGTSLDPYLINSEQILRNFAFLNNNYTAFEYHKKSYKITDNITLQKDFFTVCTSALPFDGNFDGGYKVINNLNIAGGAYTGFFASLSANAVVSRLFIESGSIVGTNNIGTISGYLWQGAKISDSYSGASVTAQTNGGGLAGVNLGQIADSFFVGEMTGETNIGGIAGKNGESGTIIRCFSAAYVLGLNNVGGIVGQNQGSISICQVSGTVHLITANGYSGGLAGEHLLGEITSGYVIAVLTSEGGGAKTGGLVGQFTNTGDATMTYCYYHTAITQATTPYYIGTTPFGDTTGRIKNTEQMLSSAFLGDLNYNFSFGLAASKDADFAPRITSFVNTGIERKEFYSAQSVKLRVFGWDNTSHAEWGTEANPYIISTPKQLDTLSRLVTTYKYTYTSNYFVLSNDIDMQGIAFVPIGRFIAASDSGNFMFNGVFDGNGKTIYNLYINRTHRYIGLFGYTGSSFVLKNLILDDSCEFVTSENYAGSLVGYNGGTVDRCVSYAAISAANYIGGLCAYSAANTAVTNSVFYGDIPSVVTNSYGVLGVIPSAGIAVNTSNTWYVYKNNSPINIETSALPYLHNDYGSVLFVDSYGDIAININTLTTNIESILSFGIAANTYYVGAVMSSNDGLVYSGSTFYPYPIFNGAKTTTFVRFCQTARLNFLEPSESAYMTNYATNYGNGIYYSGQSVNFTIKLQKNYYLENLPYYAANNYQLRNVTTDISLRFVMGSNSEGAYFEVPISIKDATALVNVTCSDLALNNVFDGATKTVEVAFSGGVFDYYTLSYYYGVGMDNVSEIRNAGVYTVYTYLYLVDNRSVFFGIMQNSFTLLPYELSLDNSIDAINNYWAAVVGVKTYDGSAQSLGRAILNQYLLTIASADISQVIVNANVNWASANAGEHIDVTISNFVLSGAMAINYTLSSGTTLNLVASGKINKKELIVTISSNDLSTEFSGNVPIIKNPQVNGSLGTTSLVWSFVKLNELGEIDLDWVALVTKTYFVGNYNILVSAQDTNNYDITFGGSSYVLNICPRMVNAVSYSNFEGKVYTGSVLSNNIRASYQTVNGVAFAILTYYEGSVSAENEVVGGVVKAGHYIAVPSITDSNYQMGAGVNNLTFDVAKATAGAIAYDMDSANISVNDMRIITFNTDIYDATLSIEIRGTSRARISIITVVGESTEYYFNPTAYPSSGSVEYRIAAKGATNYNDRYSEYRTVSIEALKIYVGVKNRTHIYGDIIDLELQYSTDYEQTNIIDIEDVHSLEGYKASTYQVVYNIIEAESSYDVNINGGDFAAYKIFDASTCYINIAKRPIRVSVPTEIQTSNTKIYGSNDTVINYLVIDTHDQSGKQISILPNGETLVLNGVLSRASGENAGNYSINLGTLNAVNNPNYDIEGDFRGNYKIDQKPLSLYIPAGSKYYKAPDPVFAVALESGYSFAYNDTMNIVNVTVVRDVGENVGSYNYRVTSSTVGNNYRIENIRNDNVFEILRGNPITTHTVKGTLYYGETIASLSISGNAFYSGAVVSGQFSWLQPDTSALSMEPIVARVVFTPTDTTNYAPISSLVSLTVNKRVINVSFEGRLGYEYSGENQCDIVAKFSDLFNGDTVIAVPSITLDGKVATPKNAGIYTYQVTIDSDKYQLSNSNSVNFEIYKKDVKVSVNNLSIVKGDTPQFNFVYTGFLNGDNEKTIENKAKIAVVPNEVGRHTITPSGASDKNYDFEYISGILTINQKQISSDNLTISGAIKPGVTVEVVHYESNRKEFKSAANLIDKSMGVNIAKPSNMTLNQLIGIDFSEKVSGEYSYSVSLKQAASASDVYYVLTVEGDVFEIGDYTLSEDGKTLTFTATAIRSIAVYAPKGTVDMLKGYIPHAVAAVLVLLTITLAVTLLRLRIKKDKARKAYLKHLDN